MASVSVPAIRLSPQGRRMVMWVLWISAGLGFLLGIEVMALHLTMDPLADARVYYDAGARLNAGQPLYDAAATDSVGLYLNPPLLAILWRPLALLPFGVASAIWMVVTLGALALVFRRIARRGRVALMVVGWLALPIGWAISVGQAEPIVTLMLTIGSPAAIAFAGNLKLAPLLVAVYWAARGEWRTIGRLALWVAAIGVIQLLLEPNGTLAFLRLTWLHPAFDVHNISPFAISPILWAGLFVALGAVAWRLGRTQFGWAAAVFFAVFAYPRLLVYQLMSLLATLGGPRDDGRSASPEARA